MNKFLASFQLNRLFILLYAILAITAASQAYFQTAKTAPGESPSVTKYNNYVIFKYSHCHLLEGKDLYKAYYPDEYWDLYKYSPTFALFFGCFAWFPDWLGLSLWNLLNALIFFLAVRYLPGIDDKKKMWILLFAASDILNSLQNSQSNALVAGLIILGFGLFEQKNYFLATLCLVATFYIKIFGIVALIMLLFYPGKWKSMAYAVIWLVLLWVIPAVITGFGPLIKAYVQYVDMLKNDQSVSLGISVMGVIKSWFGLNTPKTILAITGLIIMCLPILNIKKFAIQSNRLLFLCAMLIWMVIFNHKAESPTFIIATSGVYIWFFSEKKSAAGIALLVLAVIFTTLSSTDLFPASWRDGFFLPYNIKAVPCILIWGAIVIEMFKPNRENSIQPAN